MQAGLEVAAADGDAAATRLEVEKAELQVALAAAHRETEEAKGLWRAAEVEFETRVVHLPSVAVPIASE